VGFAGDGMVPLVKTEAFAAIDLTTEEIRNILVNIDDSASMEEE
jgi:hypothetical protein